MWNGAEAARGRRAGHAARLLRAAALAAAVLLAFLGFPPAPAAAQAAEVTSAGTLRVLHAPRHRALAREVIAQARRPLPLPGFGAGGLPDSATIVLAPSPADFAAATGGGAPEWAGGVAIPSLRRIVLPVYPSAAVRQQDAAATLRHEVVHLALHARLGDDIPRWFNEGYAEVASGSWDAEQAWQLRVAFLLGRVPPLDSLTLDWPREAARARFAYLLSATAVQHLQRLGGERGFALLMQRWQREGSLDRALRSTYGMTVGTFEDDWAKDVRKRYGWVLAVSNAALIWLAATALAMIAWIPRRRRNRRRLAAMEAEDRQRTPPRPAWAGAGDADDDASYDDPEGGADSEDDDPYGSTEVRADAEHR